MTVVKLMPAISQPSPPSEFNAAIRSSPEVRWSQVAWIDYLIFPALTMGCWALQNYYPGSTFLQCSNLLHPMHLVAQ